MIEGSRGDTEAARHGHTRPQQDGEVRRFAAHGRALTVASLFQVEHERI
jgi:hypothetical protein